MATKNQPRFDLDALRTAAGETTFARGSGYHEAGKVRVLALGPERVLAEVTGAEDYRTVLTGRGAWVGGECSCPAFDNWGFCKHMVAVALAANAADGSAETEGADILSAIREHLKEQDTDTLVEMIVDVAEEDMALFRKLEMAAATRHADDETLEARLGRAIDTATDTGGYVDYRGAGDWAADVNGALDAVAGLVSAGRGSIALTLAERAIDRIADAFGRIDDSDGDCGAVLARAQDIHLGAARAAPPEDRVQFARALFARETEDEYGVFDGAVGLYADVLGADGLAEYRRLASEAWEALPPRPAAMDGRPTFFHEYGLLAGILDFFAERDGDVEARIALRTKDLSSPWRYHEVAEFCRSQGRDEDAVRWAEEGLWVFEDAPPDERLVHFAADLLAEMGRTEDAQAHLWRAFETAPNLGLYDRLRKLGGDAMRDRMVASLEARVAEEKPAPWQHPADILVHILTQEKMFEAAWAAVRKHGTSPAAKEALARASETTHPCEAVEVYSERVDRLAESGGNPAYAEAAKLVARIAALQSAAAQASYVAALKTRFGRKRNFMKLLG